MRTPILVACAALSACAGPPAVVGVPELVMHNAGPGCPPGYFLLLAPTAGHSQFIRLTDTDTADRLTSIFYREGPLDLAPPLIAATVNGPQDACSPNGTLISFDLLRQ